MKRVYTIWPADREGHPSTASADWRQSSHWLVLDVTEGLSCAHVVEGPVSRWDALKRELELRAVAKASRKTAHKESA